MGIYIKGMEMPTSCLRCKCMYDGSCCFKGYFMEDEEWEIAEVARLSDCPLVHVPPHGRLIDAEEFLKRAIGTKRFHGDYALMLEELVGGSTTIIPASEKEEEE